MKTKLIIGIVILGLILSGCVPTSEQPFRKYQLENGDIIECKTERMWTGSLSLTDCIDGNEYLMLVNLKRLK